jgi:conjugal transfer pilus assembly protein TraI
MSWLASLFSLLTGIFRLFVPKDVASTPHAAPSLSFNPDPDYTSPMEDVPRYPPFDKGLPAISVDLVLRTQQTLVDRIEAADLPYAIEAVRNLASYVHLLPATTNDFFCGAGGLLRLCLETGFHSYVSSQGNIFTIRDPVERRRDLEPRWQLAAFLSGLCCEVGRAIDTSVVTNDRGEQWPPFEPLTQWLERTESKRYFLRPPQSSPAHPSHDPAHLSGIIINAIIPQAALQHVTTDDRSILMAMLNTISRITDTYQSGHFPRTVRHVRDQVIARDQKSNPLTFGTPLVGVYVEPYLINAMRHLVLDGLWKINGKLARVHLAPDGCFVFWTTGVPEILALLRDQGATGIPTDPRTLGELLLRSEVLQANTEGGLWWYIRPPGSTTTYEVVKFSNPGILLDEQLLASTTMHPTDICISRPPQSTVTVDPAGVSQPTEPGTQAASSSPADEEQSTSENPTSPDYNRALSMASTGSRSTAPQTTAVQQAPVPASRSSSQPGARAPRVPNRPPRPIRPTQVAEASNEQNAPPAPQQHELLASVDIVDPPEAPSERAGYSFRPSIQAAMCKIRDLHNTSPKPQTVWTPDGIAIPRSFVKDFGDSAEIRDALAQSGVLHVEPEKASNVNMVDIEGVQTPCFVIMTAVAVDFGFKVA